MGSSMEKLYDIMYRDNDKYVRIYGDPSAQKLNKDPYDGRRSVPDKAAPREEEKSEQKLKNISD